MANLYNEAGKVAVYDGVVGGDVTLGLAYCVQLVNDTGADIVAGTVTIQDASRSEADPCVPNADWANIEIEPSCGDPLSGTDATPATVTLSATNKIPARSQCGIWAPCPRPFVRVVVTGATGLKTFIVVTRLNITGYHQMPVAA